jgi:Flp pilus assembly protein CpaB
VNKRLTNSNSPLSKGSRIAIVIGILAVVAVAGVVVASNQAAPQNNETNNPLSNQSENMTGKKVTIDLNENLGLKEKP